jgi:hypothetical protein
VLVHAESLRASSGWNAGEQQQRKTPHMRVSASEF